MRVLAARLIGEMRCVSQGYLEQNLDKKLMSNMRIKRNAHEMIAGLVSSGEWSSGSRNLETLDRIRSVNGFGQERELHAQAQRSLSTV